MSYSKIEDIVSALHSEDYTTLVVDPAHLLRDDAAMSPALGHRIEVRGRLTREVIIFAEAAGTPIGRLAGFKGGRVIGVTVDRAWVAENENEVPQIV